MNTKAHIIRRGFTAFTAATAFFAITACGTEIAPPTQDIGGTQQKETKAPEQPTRTSPTRQDFPDEQGAPSYWPTPEGHDATGSGNGYPGPADGGPTDPIDRTKDWH